MHQHKAIISSILAVSSFSILVGASSLLFSTVAAYGHFFGLTVTIDDYQVMFAPYPSPPLATRNSTLNFSVLDNNSSNILNIYSALVITEKDTGIVVEQVPYTLYEFSDIIIPYVFQKPGDYVVRLDTRITGDEKYQAQPLSANFDIAVADPNLPQIMFDIPTILFSVSGVSAIAAVVLFLYYRRL